MRAVHLVHAAAVLVALGAIGGVAQLGHYVATPHPASSPAAIRQVPVTAAARACPPAPGGGSAPVALLAGASSVGHAQRGQSDQVELTALPPAGLAVRAASPVPAHQTVTESLSSVARGSGVVAIEVHTSIGRVAADVSAESHGVTSWLPGTAAPSTRLVVPGVPPSGSTAGLFLADPGPSTAKVTVTAITPQGH